LVCSTDFGGVSLIWDLRTGKKIQHFQGHSGRVLACDFAPDGFSLATGGDDGSVKIWDLRTKSMRSTAPAHRRLISTLEYSASGESILTASYDGTMRVLSARDSSKIRVLEGHDGRVCAGAWGEREIWSVGGDGTLKLWRGN